jgi:hypothetical protein
MDPAERLADVHALSECRQQVDNVAASQTDGASVPQEITEGGKRL